MASRARSFGSPSPMRSTCSLPPSPARHSDRRVRPASLEVSRVRTAFGSIRDGRSRSQTLALGRPGAAPAVSDDGRALPPPEAPRRPRPAAQGEAHGGQREEAAEGAEPGVLLRHAEQGLALVRDRDSAAPARAPGRGVHLLPRPPRARHGGGRHGIPDAIKCPSSRRSTRRSTTRTRADAEKHYKVLMDEYPKVTAVFLSLKKSTETSSRTSRGGWVRDEQLHQAWSSR